MKKLLITLVLAVVAPLALAADESLQNYDVELLIFRVIRPSASPENWALETAEPHTAAPILDAEETAPTPSAQASETPAATAAPPTAESFSPLAPAQFKLNGIEDTLRKGKTYQPVAHFGWTQPGFPLNAAPKFPLQGYLPAFLPDNIVLSGQASLARGRYLHLLLELTYQAPDGQKYVLREQRRMRSTEKHYFDHPYFGVIALITPKT